MPHIFINTFAGDQGKENKIMFSSISGNTFARTRIGFFFTSKPREDCGGREDPHGKPFQYGRWKCDIH